MQPPALVKERVSRLTGRGRTDDRGGGLPLTDLFVPILRILLDEGQQQVDVITAAVRAGFIGRKEDRLQYMYQTANPWPALMDDALAQLESTGLVIRDGARWELGPKFALDKPLVVVRAGEGSPRSTVTVASEATREAREGEGLLIDITSLATELDARRGGLRKVSPDRVAELVASMHAVGYVKDSKIYKDQHGRVLDGRHRLAAAEIAGITLSEATHYRTITVSSDQEALEWAWHLNKGQASWTRPDIERLTKLLGGKHPDEALPGPLVRAQIAMEAAVREIQTNADRTQREIAKAAKVSVDTVNRAMKELKSAGEELKTSAERKREAVQEVIAENPEASNREVAREAGVDDKTVAAVRRAESVRPTEQIPQPEPVAPKAHPSRQNWTLGWVGDYGEAPQRIVRKLMREPEIAREVLRLLHDELGVSLAEELRHRSEEASEYYVQLNR